MQDPGELAGLVYLTCWSSLLESRCPRGGGVAWASVLLLAQLLRRSRACPLSDVQVLSRDPRPDGQTERATLRLGPAEYSGAGLATGGEQIICGHAEAVGLLVEHEGGMQRVTVRQLS